MPNVHIDSFVGMKVSEPLIQADPEHMINSHDCLWLADTPMEVSNKISNSQVLPKNKHLKTVSTFLHGNIPQDLNKNNLYTGTFSPNATILSPCFVIWTTSLVY